LTESKTIQSFSPLEINELGASRVEIFQNVSSTDKNNFILPGFNRMHAIGGYGAMQFSHFAGEGFDINYVNKLKPNPTKKAKNKSTSHIKQLII
jgi:hypothetical protein